MSLFNSVVMGGLIKILKGRLLGPLIYNDYFLTWLEFLGIFNESFLRTKKIKFVRGMNLFKNEQKLKVGYITEKKSLLFEESFSEKIWDF